MRLWHTNGSYLFFGIWQVAVLMYLFKLEFLYDNDLYTWSLCLWMVDYSYENMLHQRSSYFDRRSCVALWFFCIFAILSSDILVSSMVLSTMQLSTVLYHNLFFLRILAQKVDTGSICCMTMPRIRSACRNLKRWQLISSVPLSGSLMAFESVCKVIAHSCVVSDNTVYFCDSNASDITAYQYNVMSYADWISNLCSWCRCSLFYRRIQCSVDISCLVVRYASSPCFTHLLLLSLASS